MRSFRQDLCRSGRRHARSGEEGPYGRVDAQSRSLTLIEEREQQISESQE
jgi:hypothetical protein